ncbi:hypothetical protein [Hydrogenophaga sp. 2FB]|uniref:hypothetical protein n=1 Tax=Hydrogenophaga sp. 2FB TaxID=2502187 RepID=UPI0010F70510|nr:hypothetical protein [Hydrogenophaga sp. 2FB]
MNESNPIILDKGLVRMSSRPSVTWTSVIATATALIGVATVLLHLMGVVIHQTYLYAWGVNSDQFPKSVDWLLIRGYYGVWNGAGMLLLTFLKNFHWVVLASAILVLYARLLTGSWNPFLVAEKKLGWFKRLPVWVQKILTLAAIGTWLAILLVSVTVVMFFLVGIPATVGGIIGKEFAATNVKDFSKGCQESRSNCIQLLRRGEPMGTGYVLDSSSTHLAYFDIGLKRARVIPRHEIETLTVRAPAQPSGPVQ